MKSRVPFAAAAALLALTPEVRTEEVFPVIDLHVDVPLQVRWKKRALPLDTGQLTRDAMKAGHVVGVVLPAYVPDKRKPDPDDLRTTIRAVSRVRDSEPFADGTVRSWLAMEGARSIEEDEAGVDEPLRAGLRLIGLVHMADNALGGSSTGKKKGGLTDRGKAMAKRALDGGALLDASHLSDAAFDDALALAKEKGVPLVASHSNARAKVDHPRNLTDDQLRAVAKTGGVVGLNLHLPYLGGDHDPSMDEIVAMLDHMVSVAGEDHVAIGSDFDGEIKAPKVLKDPSRWPALAAALTDEGWSAAKVRKVFAENARRVLDAKKPQ